LSKATGFPREAADGAPTRGTALPGTLKWIGIYAGVALVVFLLGLVPMWMKASEAASQRDAARRELRLSRTQGALASAAIDARRGEYETARQTASDFFTTLRGELDEGDDSPLNARQREATAPLLQRRDEVITLLARSDPASAERLSDLYVSYRAAMDSVPEK
jgi:predicted exporter